jgi:hypothetical protein
LSKTVATLPDLNSSRNTRVLTFGRSCQRSSPSAQAVQLQIQRAMPGEQRLIMALEMSLFARELSKLRIQQEHPDWTEAHVVRELLSLVFLPAPMPAPLP